MRLAVNLCVALLTCGYCTVSASSEECPDFSDFDVCSSEDDLDSLQVSFGECDVKVTPLIASNEPVVKYEDADAVYTSICVGANAQ